MEFGGRSFVVIPRRLRRVTTISAWTAKLTKLCETFGKTRSIALNYRESTNSQLSVVERELALLQCKAGNLGSMGQLKVLLGNGLAKLAPSLNTERQTRPGKQQPACLTLFNTHTLPVSNF